MATIFKNSRGNVRSGWKIALMFSLFISSALLVEFFFNRFSPTTPSYVVEMLQNLCEIGAVVFSVRVVERDSLRNFGFPKRSGALRSLVWGVSSALGPLVRIRSCLWPVALPSSPDP